MITLGTTLFSLTPDWRAGAEATTLLERVATAGCGPAVELIGHQAWRGFPLMSTVDEYAFRDAVDRFGLMPAALGVYADLYRRPGQPMSTDDAMDGLRPQLEAAVRLGFPVVRAALGVEPSLLRRMAAEAERLGVVLTFEVQGSTAPDAPAVQEVMDLQATSGSPYLGFTLDFSVTTPRLPVALDTALRRLGVGERAVAEIHRVWEAAESIGAALAAVAGHPRGAQVANLVAGVLGRCGRSQTADWATVLPLVRHAHAKFWDPDLRSVRESHDAWLAALDDAGYAGAVVSEWGGHELLDRADADALTVIRAHVQLLNELAGADRSVMSR